MNLPTLSRKALVAWGVLGLAITISAFFLGSTFSRLFRTPWTYALVLVAPVVMLLISVGSFLLAYLKPEPIRVNESWRQARENAALVREDIEGARAPNNDQLADNRETVSAEEPNSEGEPPDPREREIAGIFILTQTRLRQEIDALGKRSSLNLVVGVLITAAATTLLVYLVSREHGRFQDLKDVLAYYIPRITTVALIETFAYFFLGLYKANLQEIKFYQGERTTIAAIEIAWRASLWPEIGAPTADVIQQIVRTDRNRPSPVAAAKDGSPSQADILEIIKGLTKIAGDSAKGKE